MSKILVAYFSISGTTKAAAEEIANLLIGNIQLRNRVMGNGKQIVLDDSKTPKYYSKSDATLAYLYNDSKGKVENPEGIDQDIVNLHGTIAGFIEDLRDIDMAKIIEYVEDTIKIPQIVKTQLMRFAGVKKEVLTFVESRQIGEVEYYDKKAEKLMKKALNISRNNEINEIS